MSSQEPCPEADGLNAETLLPEIYEELRRLANYRMSSESPQTIGATALVHEAYLRLQGQKSQTEVLWANKRQFFSAAAEAMRRILIDRARARNAAKRGGGVEIDQNITQIVAPIPDDELIEISEALEKFAMIEPEIAEAVKLKYFVGLNWEEIAEVTGISVRTVRRQWAFARSWLYSQIRRN